MKFFILLSLCAFSAHGHLTPEERSAMVQQYLAQGALAEAQEKTNQSALRAFKSIDIEIKNLKARLATLESRQRGFKASVPIKRVRQRKPAQVRPVKRYDPNLEQKLKNDPNVKNLQRIMDYQKR